MECKVSQREQLLDELVEVLHEKGLNEVYGINTGIADIKKYRYATFCRARVLDGEVKVFGTKFIQIKWETANRSLPQRGSEVFRSIDEAKEFIKKTF